MNKALLYELGQSVSFGRLSLKAKVLWPMLLAASDAQGRGLAEPDAVKWRICPNVIEISLDEVPGLLAEMEGQEMIILFVDARGRGLYQIARWWEFQQLAWASPSRLSPPEGWTDRIRYRKAGAGIVRENWERSGGMNGEGRAAQLPMDMAEDLDDGDGDDGEGSAYVAATYAQGSGQSNLNESKVKKEDDDAVEAPGSSEGAEAPSPLPVPVQQANLTAGQREVLALFGAKRYRTTAARDQVLALEQQFGTGRLLEAAKWAAVKQLTLGDAIGAITAALPTWGQPKVKSSGRTKGNGAGKGSTGAGSGWEQPSAADTAAVRAAIERKQQPGRSES